MLFCAAPRAWHRSLVPIAQHTHHARNRSRSYHLVPLDELSLRLAHGLSALIKRKVGGGAPNPSLQGTRYVSRSAANSASP